MLRTAHILKEGQAYLACPLLPPLTIFRCKKVPLGKGKENSGAIKATRQKALAGADHGLVLDLFAGGGCFSAALLLKFFHRVADAHVKQGKSGAYKLVLGASQNGAVNR